jgi:hypothetical protein
VTAHFPSYSLSPWDGCENAKLQAVSTADRPLCAAVVAYASYLRTGRIFGTLATCDAAEIRAWVDDVCFKHSVDLVDFCRWTNALSGYKFDTQWVPASALGLTMDPYQWTAIRALTCGGGVIGAFMGAGKTLMGVCAAIGHLKGEHGERCWIFCPLNAIPAWEDARDRALSAHFGEVKIISIDSAHKYTAVAKGDVMIVDEVHRAKSHKSRRASSLHTIRSRFAFGIMLTGTFVHAGVAAALSIKDLAVPGLALFATTWTAGETFKCIVRKNIGSREVSQLEAPPAAMRDSYNRWLAHGVHLITPESHEVQSAFKLPEQDLQEISLGAPWPKIEEEVARIANAIFEETGELPHAQAVAHLLARAGVEDKLDWLAGELVGAEDAQIVVFANYRDSLDAAEEMLKELEASYVRVDGDVVGDDRAEAQRKFQSGEARVFLGQIHAASESMNLQCANVSLTLDVSWSCIDYSQALARTHRRGQQHTCLHVDLVANHLQARILDRLRSGQDFAAACAEYQEIRRTLTTQGATNE